ncbi:MAG: ParB/RepB/Spo0J family partition protein, partial [Erysipelotrichaceae bacterium]|nr:ParB/RepB/Spo0J family partition protein [Erysipelotrichaceae bacterium]
MKKEIVRIKLNKIIPNKNQPRLDFYDDSIKGLAESIKQNGLLQPVTVRKNGDKYELIAGERRYRASLLNGASDIEAIIMESSDEESANLALIENLQREDLNAIEQA